MIVYGCLMGITIISHIFFRARAQRYNYFDNNKSSDVEGKTLIVFFTLYIALLSLRDSSVGVDTSYYLNRYFYQYKFISWGEILQNYTGEIGFFALSKIITDITNSPNIYLAIIAIVSVTPILYLYKKECQDALLCASFFLISLLFEAFFSALREGVALGLVVPAFYFTKKKKIVHFLLTVFLASRFHMSALILVLLYPVYYANITVKWLWAVVPAVLAIYRYNGVVFNTLLTTIGGRYADKYLIYGYNATGQYGLLILFLLIAVYSFLMLDEEQADESDIGVRNILLLTVVLQLFAPLHVLASRMNYYFILFIPIVLARTNVKCKRRYWQIAKLAKYVMIIYFIIYFFFIKGDSLRIMNYQFFF